MSAGDGSPLPEDSQGWEHAEPVLELANEYALVLIQRVHTHNGVRLQITSPRLGHRIQLDPLELESLTWQTHDTFTRFLETPMGPEEETP